MHEQDTQNAENAENKIQEKAEVGSDRASPVLHTESHDMKVERLAHTVESLLEMFQGILPVITKLAEKENEAELKIESSASVERKPWDRGRPSPTFTDFAGSLAYESPEVLLRDRPKRRETIFDESEKLINKFFKDLYAYQSEHDCHEKGCPHLAWSVRSILCPVGMSDRRITYSTVLTPPPPCLSNMK